MFYLAMALILSAWAYFALIQALLCVAPQFRWPGQIGIIGLLATLTVVGTVIGWGSAVALLIATAIGSSLLALAIPVRQANPGPAALLGLIIWPVCAIAAHIVIQSHG